MNDVYKKELSLSLNPFGRPREYSGKAAWAHLIMNLIMMEPGTYPSQPNMGVGLNRFSYQTIDTWASEVQSLINDQIKTYLPDIPLENIKLIDHTNEKGNYVIFQITFSDEIGEDRCVAVATEQKNNEIHFEISDNLI